MLRTNARRDQARYPEPGSVGKANAPGAFPRAIRRLVADQKLSAAIDGSKNRSLLSRLEHWRCPRVRRERLDASGGAFDVRIVHHDASKNVRRIQKLKPLRPACPLVRGPATVVVLKREDELDRVVEALSGNPTQVPRFQEKRCLDAL